MLLPTQCLNVRVCAYMLKGERAREERERERAREKQKLCWLTAWITRLAVRGYSETETQIGCADMPRFSLRGRGPHDLRFRWDPRRCCLLRSLNFLRVTPLALALSSFFFLVDFFFFLQG